ncbi:hypothetical protein NCC49_003070 [Naganishia albida]|nr:hypothetical protein NCC49_003070 [Naganishia albida]
MFGGNWNTQQQQQPQQQATGLFGQPAQQPAATGGFGQPAQTGGFGQPATGGMFGGGGFGSTGGFGATNTQTNAFGATQARPAFGATGSTGGLFGGNTTNTGTFGSTGGFGAAAAAPASTSGGLFGSTTNAFGAKPATTTTFGAPAATGTTGGLFGAKPATATATGGFGVAAATPQPVSNGSLAPPYQPLREKDGTAANAGWGVYNTITCMPEYRGSSLEEIRLQDYAAGRKTAPPAGTAPTTGFGQPAAASGGLFGQPAQTASTGLFGQQPAANAFGQPAASTGTGLFGAAQPASTNAFGQPQQQGQTNAFGQPAQTSLFGQPAQQNTGTGLFGQTQPAQPAGGLFGSTASQPSTGLFGATSTSTTQPTGGLFGQQNTTSTGFGGFGANQQQAAKPAFGFGASAPATTTPAFGQPAQTTAPSFGFGQQQQQNQTQPSTGFGFGATQNNTAGTTGTGLFGAAAQPQQQSGGLFGAAATNNAPKPGGLFGSTGTQPATGGGLFGSTGGFGATQQQQQPATSLFGSTNNSSTNTTGGGLFGASNNTTATQGQTGTTGGSLFGGFGTQNKPAAPTGGGLFGSTPAQPAGTSLFGNTGTTGGFGNTGATGGTSLFGNTQTNQQQQTAQPAAQSGGLFGGGSLFGNNNANKPAGGGLFGSTGAQPATGGGLFGNLGQSQTQQQPQQQQNNTGFGTGSLFGNQSTSGNALGNSQSQQPAPQINPNDPYGAGNLFANPPNFAPINTSTTKALPPLTSSFKMPTPVKQSMRLRGYATSPYSHSPALGASTLGNSALGLSTASSGSQMRGSLFDRPSADVLSPAAFTPRSSVKKLVIEKKVNGANLSASLSQSTNRQVDRSLINPDADGEVNGNASVFGANESISGTPSRSVSKAPANKPAPATKSLNTLSRNVDLDDFEEGEYYTIPDMHSLCNATMEELQSVEDFVVGRKGYGELRYLESVDVASAGDLKKICGEIVIFARGTCEVYPESTENMEPGTGLNHRARITLEKCFPKDKSTGEPVRDPTAPRVQQHLRKLKGMEGTHFQNYDPPTGTWVFEVDHFTKYGLDDDETEDEDEQLYNGDQQSNSSGNSALNSPERRAISMTTETTRSPSRVGSAASTVSQDDVESDHSINAKANAQADFSFIFNQDTPKASRFNGLPYFHKAEEDDVREFDMTNVEPTSFGEYQLPSSFQPTWSYQSLPGTSSLAHQHERLFADVGAFRSRSFGVGWDLRGGLVSYGKVAALDAPNQFQPFSISSQPSVGVSTIKEADRQHTQEMLDLQIERSDIQVLDDLPRIRTQDTLQFKHLASVFAGDKGYEAQIWRLAAALYDDLEVPESTADELDVDIHAFSRKMAFSDWLKNAVALAAERADLNAAQGPDKVFALLSGHRVEEAVNHALESGDMRLASLLATIGNEETKKAMALQLDAWSRDKSDAHMSKEYRRVYALLAGIADVSDKGDVDITDGLEWLRAFALSFWYKTPLEQPIEMAVEAFQERLEQVPTLPRPVLKHVSAYRRKQEAAPEDAVYSLVKVFCQQDRVLDVLSDPAIFGRTASDARIQWHLCNMLLNVKGYGSDDEDGGRSDAEKFDRLTVAYADQLEKAGLWTMAAFALLHLGEDHARIRAVKDLLLRHVEELDEDSISFLVNSLCIPRSWIAEAEAFNYRTNGEVYEEFLVSLEAGLFNRAHGIVVDRLASEAILREDVAVLERLLEKLPDEVVDEWDKGGGLLADYAKAMAVGPEIIKNVKALKRSSDGDLPEDVQSLQDLLASLAPRVERLWRHGSNGLYDADVDLQNQAAKMKMLEGIYRYAGELASHSKMKRLAPSSDLPEASRLRMMQDAALDRFNRQLEINVM